MPRTTARRTSRTTYVILLEAAYVIFGGVAGLITFSFGRHTALAWAVGVAVFVVCNLIWLARSLRTRYSKGLRT